MLYRILIIAYFGIKETQFHPDTGAWRGQYDIHNLEIWFWFKVVVFSSKKVFSPHQSNCRTQLQQAKASRFIVDLECNIYGKINGVVKEIDESEVVLTRCN